jgi:hypothetical protein
LHARTELKPESNMSRELLFLVALLIAFCGCEGYRRTDGYSVVQRTNDNKDSFVAWVPVVLEHHGHKYFARCNNIKAVDTDSKHDRGCELHVGMTVRCQFFTNRDISGYDLICGSKRNEKGDLDTYGENELLFIDKEEN